MHRISDGDGWFLELKRIDLLTQRPFQVGDEVVVCSSCRAVNLAESWAYNEGNKCVACGCTDQKSGFSRNFITFADLKQGSGPLRGFGRFRIVGNDGRSSRFPMLSAQTERQILIALCVVLGIFLAAFISYLVGFSPSAEDALQTIGQKLEAFADTATEKLTPSLSDQSRLRTGELTQQVRSSIGSAMIGEKVSGLWDRFVLLFQRAKAFPGFCLDAAKDLIANVRDQYEQYAGRNG